MSCGVLLVEVQYQVFEVLFGPERNQVSEWVAAARSGTVPTALPALPETALLLVRWSHARARHDCNTSCFAAFPPPPLPLPPTHTLAYPAPLASLRSIPLLPSTLLPVSTPDPVAPDN